MGVGENIINIHHNLTLFGEETTKKRRGCFVVSPFCCIFADNFFIHNMRVFKMLPLCVREDEERHCFVQMSAYSAMALKHGQLFFHLDGVSSPQMLRCPIIFALGNF